MQIKVFKGKDAYDVEHNVNTFAKDNRFEVISITTGFLNDEMVVTITFRWR